MSTSARLSIELQTIASALNEMLSEAAGKEITWVLLCSADDVAQYISNASRPDGRALIESLLQRWTAGRADIPAHYNPDLRDSPPEHG